MTTIFGESKESYEVVYEARERVAALAPSIAKLQNLRDKKLDIAERLMRTADGGQLDDASFKSWRAAIDGAAKDDEQIERLQNVSRSSANAVAVLTKEPRTYGPAHPENSWWRDSYVFRVGEQHPNYRGAVERLERHSREVGVEIRERTPEGLRARTMIREEQRTIEEPNRAERNAFDEEMRAASSGSASLGAFVSPYYSVDQWVPFDSAPPAFADQCKSLPLPAYGLTVSVPSFTSTAQTGLQTENSGVSDLDPSGAYLTGTLQTIAGQITPSQQLFDRGGMDGLSFDQILNAQIQEQADATYDLFVLNQALAGAGTVTDATFSMANFYADLAKGRESLSDTAGTRLVATHLFKTSDLFGYVTRQVDATTNRPILTPDSGALVAATAMGDPQWQSWSGVHMGALRWHLDDNIPASGSNTQMIVARPGTVLVWKGDPIPYAYPETESGSLSVVCGVRMYVACVPRFAKGVSTIGGNAYPTTLI